MTIDGAGGLPMNAVSKKPAGCIGFLCLILLTSCGGGSMPAPAAGDFALAATPASVSLVPGGGGQQISVNAVAANGFSGMVNVAIAGLPNGVTAEPATLSLTPGAAQTVTVTASASAAAGSAMVTFTGTSGALSHSATVGATISTPPPAGNFRLTAAPARISLVGGGGGQPISVNAVPVNCFTGMVNVAITGLPSGVTAQPATLS